MNYLKKLIKKILYFLPRIILLSAFFLYVSFAFLTYFDYLEPYLFPLHFIRGKAYYISEDIIVGPYPHHEELKKLKERYRVEVIISLLNTDLPQEKALFEKERSESEKLGLEIVSFPLEYLAINSESNNKARKAIIRTIAGNKAKKIYIHCYLGKHRVGFVKKGIAEAGIKTYDKGKDVSTEAR